MGTRAPARRARRARQRRSLSGGAEPQLDLPQNEFHFCFFVLFCLFSTNQSNIYIYICMYYLLGPSCSQEPGGLLGGRGGGWGVGGRRGGGGWQGEGGGRGKGGISVLSKTDQSDLSFWFTLCGFDFWQEGSQKGNTTFVSWLFGQVSFCYGFSGNPGLSSLLVD